MPIKDEVTDPEVEQKLREASGMKQKTPPRALCIDITGDVEQIISPFLHRLEINTPGSDKEMTQISPAMSITLGPGMQAPTGTLEEIKEYYDNLNRQYRQEAHEQMRMLQMRPTIEAPTAPLIDLNTSAEFVIESNEMVELNIASNDAVETPAEAYAETILPLGQDEITVGPTVAADKTPLHDEID